MKTIRDEIKLNAMPFTYAEMLVLLEAARIALSDADNFDDTAKAMDISDAEMSRISTKLQAFMDEDVKAAEKVDLP